MAESLHTGSAVFPQGILTTEPCEVIPQPAGGDADSFSAEQPSTNQAPVPAATPQATPIRRADVSEKREEELEPKPPAFALESHIQEECGHSIA